MAVVLHKDGDLPLPCFQLHPDEGARVAVVDSVAQQVVKDPLQLVRVADHHHVGGQGEIPHQVHLCQNRLELKGHLLQHPGQVDLLPLQGQVGQAEPGDLEKFVD